MNKENSPTPEQLRAWSAAESRLPWNAALFTLLVWAGTVMNLRFEPREASVFLLMVIVLFGFVGWNFLTVHPAGREFLGLGPRGTPPAGPEATPLPLVAGVVLAAFGVTAMMWNIPVMATVPATIGLIAAGRLWARANRNGDTETMYGMPFPVAAAVGLGAPLAMASPALLAALVVAVVYAAAREKSEQEARYAALLKRVPGGDAAERTEASPAVLPEHERA